MPCFGEEQGAIYTFGDSELAARRLDLIAEIFALTSRAFLAEAVGCGRSLSSGPDSCEPILPEVAKFSRVVWCFPTNILRSPSSMLATVVDKIARE